jgi:hypothetical protein
VFLWMSTHSNTIGIVMLRQESHMLPTGRSYTRNCRYKKTSQLHAGSLLSPRSYEMKKSCLEQDAPLDKDESRSLWIALFVKSLDNGFVY